MKFLFNLLSLIVVSLLFLLFVPMARSQTAPITSSTAVLTWDSNTEPDMKNYIILMGTVPGVYTRTKPVLHVQSIPTQTGEFSGLLESQTYYFSVKACDTSGNCSDPATEVSGKVVIPPGVPSGLGIKIRLNITVDVP